MRIGWNKHIRLYPEDEIENEDGVLDAAMTASQRHDVQYTFSDSCDRTAR